jgi:hypothetical protein
MNVNEGEGLSDLLDMPIYNRRQVTNLPYMLYARESRYCPFQATHDLCLRLRAYDAIDLPAAFHDQQHGNALDVETLRRRGILVDVQLRDAKAAAHFLRQIVDHRRDHPAWSAPGSPQVDQHRQRGLLHVSGKCGIGNCQRLAGSD